MLCPKCKQVWPAAPERCPSDGWRLIRDRLGEVVAERFTITDFLGVGGGGSSVWTASEALAHGARRIVAIKLLCASDIHEQARFERGAVLAESLDHPNIARVYEHGRVHHVPDDPSHPPEDLHWISMELLAGESLSAYVLRKKTLPPVEAVALAEGVLAALEHAHRMEIVHRDLKPANLYVTPDPADPSATPPVRILDFGIARLTGPSAAERFGPFFPDDDPIAPELESEVTGQHRICGTPEYMAPEQILSAPPDTRSDLYALGVILYRLISGQLPYRAKTRFEIYHRHLHDAPPPLPPTVPFADALSAVLHRALAKDAAARFQTAAELRDALRLAIGLAPVPRPRLFPLDGDEAASTEPAPGLGLLPLTPPPEPLPLAPPTASPTPAKPKPVAEPTPAPTPVPPPRRRWWGLFAAALVLAGVGLGVGLSLRASAHPEPAPQAVARTP